MGRTVLLSLWLAGAAIYTGNTLLFTRVLSGGEGPVAECIVRKGTNANCVRTNERADGAKDKARAERAAEPDRVALMAAPAKPAQTPSPSQMQEAKAYPEQAAVRGSDQTVPTASAEQGNHAVMADAAPPAGNQTAAAGEPSMEGSGSAAGPVAPMQSSDNLDWAQIQNSAAFAHGGPSVEAPITSIFPRGRQVRVVAYNTGWVEVRDGTNGQSGWVYEKYVKYVGPVPEPQQAAGEPGQGSAGAKEVSAEPRARMRVREARAAVREARAARKRKPAHEPGERTTTAQRGFFASRWSRWASAENGPPGSSSEPVSRRRPTWRSSGGFRLFFFAPP
jgi:hypothetical protein